VKIGAEYLILDKYPQEKSHALKFGDKDVFSVRIEHGCRGYQMYCVCAEQENSSMVSTI
jgi:hypothetical protein